MRATTFRPLLGPVALAAALLGWSGCVEIPVEAADGAFERTITVSGPPQIDIATGSGTIEVRPGAEGRIQISGQIRANEGWWAGGGGLSAAERVRRLQDDPPIQQSGSLVRIGHIPDEQLRKGVSISYTLVVPASSSVTSRTGSGSQHVEGVSGPVRAQSGSGSLTFVRLGSSVHASTGSGGIEADGVGAAFEASTGSGSIQARGLGGAVTVKTGSGGIEVTQTGGGDVDAESGSGSVRLRGVRGAVRANTGSGGIDVEGRLAGDWRLSASSGSIRVALPPGQGYELDAATGSGHIDIAAPITLAGAADRQRMRGTVAGGGPLLRVQTSSGGVQIR